MLPDKNRVNDLMQERATTLVNWFTVDADMHINTMLKPVHLNPGI